MGYNAGTQVEPHRFIRICVMDTPAQVPGPPSRHKEFEDPHYHDDPDFDAAASEERVPDKPKARKPARQLPPPRRRFEE
jgi:hypothetical protein